MLHPTPEPFRIKMIEPIKLIPREKRLEALKRAYYNPFALRSDEIFIDLLTDSGTGAMSDAQWAGLIQGDETYAGSLNFFNLQDTAQRIFGFKHIIPTHQGRGAEHILFKALVKPGQYVIGNMHFDTTKAHIENSGGRALNFIDTIAFDTQTYHPFKGNVDIPKMEQFIRENKENIALIVLTITCNSAGGQPVSLENINKVSALAKKYKLRFFIDAARFAENAYFIKTREEKYKHLSIEEIVREIFSYADGLTLSAKKDGLVNIGGLCCVKEDEALLKDIHTFCVLYEGFITYGGLAGRDLECMARGLKEGIEYDYLHYRIAQVEYLGKKLLELGVPIQYPTGGHAVFVDAKKMLPHIPPDEFPAQSLANALYLEAGVRGVEVGSLLLGRNATSELELLRLTIPRRTYTYTHLDYVANAFARIKTYAGELRGFTFIEEPNVLRHFLAKLKPIYAHA